MTTSKTMNWNDFINCRNAEWHLDKVCKEHQGHCEECPLEWNKECIYGMLKIQIETYGGK